MTVVRTEDAAIGNMNGHSTSFPRFVTSGDDHFVAEEPKNRWLLQAKLYARGLAVAAAITAFCHFAVSYLQLADIVQFYLLGVVAVAVRYGRGPSLVAAAASLLPIDYLFMPPVYRFWLEELHHGVTLAVLVAVAVVVSGLTGRLRAERERARTAERRTATLYALEHELAAARHAAPLVAAARRHLARLIGARVTIVVDVGRPHAATPLDVAPDDGASLDETARAVLAAGEPRWPAASSGESAYLPLMAPGGPVGVVILRSRPGKRFAPEERELLQACCRQVASALERVDLAAEAERAQLQIETERVRNALLSAVSHDLKTPLALISASAEILERNHQHMEHEVRGDLIARISGQAERLASLVRNLLAMTRVESGALDLQASPGDVEEVVAAALRRIAHLIGQRPVHIDAPRGMPLVSMDGLLLELVFVNVFENAARYSPSGAPIRVRLAGSETELTIDIEDAGPGIFPDEVERVFEKFYRGRNAREQDGGAGLGLAICRAIVRAHGGTISIRNATGGGAVVRIALPATRAPLLEAAARLPELS